MKLSKKTITIGAVATLAVVLITATIFIGLQKNPVTTEDTEKQNSSTDMAIQLPSENPTESNIKAEPDDTSNPALTVNVNGDPQNPNNSNKTPAKDTEKPVNPVTPTQPNNGGGINIGGGSPQIPPYDCGTAGHKCPNEGVHRAIAKMEADGCSFCDSHNCPSFYAINKYGVYGIDVTQCPKYDKTKDPLYYCQVCHKPVGNGYNGTCIEFIDDTICPDCGVFVKGRTCHSH